MKVAAETSDQLGYERLSPFSRIEDRYGRTELLSQQKSSRFHGGTSQNADG